MSSANRNSFAKTNKQTNKKQFCIFIFYLVGFFPCLIALALTASTILNKSGENEHPFVPHLRRKTFSFSPFSMKLAVGLS